MPKQNLAALSVKALLSMRDEISAVLSKKANELKSELKSIGSDYADVGRIAVYGKKPSERKLTGRKVAPKYRDPKTKETWSGRGAMARWMAEAIKGGAKKEDFLIAKSKKAAKKAKKKAA